MTDSSLVDQVRAAFQPSEAALQAQRLGLILAHTDAKLMVLDRALLKCLAREGR